MRRVLAYLLAAWPYACICSITTSRNLLNVFYKFHTSSSTHYFWSTDDNACQKFCTPCITSVIFEKTILKMTWKKVLWDSVTWKQCICNNVLWWWCRSHPRCGRCGPWCTQHTTIGPQITWKTCWFQWTIISQEAQRLSLPANLLTTCNR